MSFADSLKTLEHSKERALIRSKEAASNLLIRIAEKAVKFATTQASKNNKKSVRGYLCYLSGYDTDSYTSLIEEWNDDDKTKEQTQYPGMTPNIYRIDRLIRVSDTEFHFEYRYPHIFRDKDTYNRLNGSCYFLSNKEIDDICDKISEMIKELGFTVYDVKPVSKQFYFYDLSVKNGIFGRKHLKKDGVGKVVYISIKW
ncbi:MAG: hypothetical protein K2N27_05425 [Ruminococcus sp.]|nr:hypothetical protein [Ruminococcus sp.]